MFDEFKRLLYTLQDRHGRFKVRGEYYHEDNMLVLYYNDYVVLKGTPSYFKRTRFDLLLKQAERQIGAIKRAMIRDIKNIKVGGWKRGITF